MNQVLVNNELSLSYPDGFHIMDGAELAQAYQNSNPNRWGIWDKDRHLIVSVFWHRTNRLLVSLADAKSVAKSTERKLRKGLKSHGYSFHGFYERELCGQRTHGFHYQYQVGDVVQSGETIILKHGSLCYTIYCYTRKDTQLAGDPVFEEILRSCSFQ